jgi:Anthrone oxygenase
LPALLELIAVLACTLFAGAALYINVAEHPARLLCGPEIAAAQFAPSYKRAAVMQVFLALTATVAGTARGIQGGGAIWLVAALLIFAVIPFTLIAIRPINNRLLDPRRDRGPAEIMALLETWGRLHAVRSALSVVAAVLFIWATASRAAAVVTGPHDVEAFVSRGWQPTGARIEAGRAVAISHLSGGSRSHLSSALWRNARVSTFTTDFHRFPQIEKASAGRNAAGCDGGTTVRSREGTRLEIDRSSNP